MSDQVVRAGSYIINEAGTVLLVTDDRHDPHNGFVLLSEVRPYLDAGYRLLGDDEVAPPQEYEIRALSRVRPLGSAEDAREAGAIVRPLAAAAKIAHRGSQMASLGFVDHADIPEDEPLEELVVVVRRAFPHEVMEYRETVTRPGVVVNEDPRVFGGI